MKRAKQRKGFTLVEVLIVVAVFSLTMLVATNIFILANRSQRQASVDQKIQGDIRFVMEAISREVRFGTIDYDCYAQGNCDPVNPAPINLSATRGETSVLALKDADGNKIRFAAFPENGERKLQVCLINAATDNPDKCASPDAGAENDWEVITPDNIRVAATTFILYPHTNPYLPCTGTCAGAYEADGQPKVTIILQTRQSGNEVVPEEISSQTTVISRFYAR